MNVHEAVAIGTEMMKHYESTWPGGFHDTLPKKERAMVITKKHIQVGSAKVYDTNLIYSRIIGLKAPGQDMHLNDVLKHESIPTSMFTNNGEMLLATSRSTLKNKLKSWSHRKICIQGNNCHHWWLSHIVGGSLANTRNSPIPRWQCFYPTKWAKWKMLTYTWYFTGTKT